MYLPISFKIKSKKNLDNFQKKNYINDSDASLFSTYPL